jgi:hypothetical protein
MYLPSGGTEYLSRHEAALYLACTNFKFQLHEKIRDGDAMPK